MKKEKITFNPAPLLIIVSVILAFLSGGLWTKLKSLEEEKAQSEQAIEEEGQPSAPAFNPKKSKKPEIKFFVMSFCPFGNQAEAGLKAVAELLGDKVN